MTWTATTRGITVTVEPRYLSDQSNPAENLFVWAYTVTIINDGPDTVQLTARAWRITDGRGHTKEVAGPGVIGEQPILRPGDSFMYTSGAPLPTPSGFMVGHYEMQTENGETFAAAIPAFSLDQPEERRVVN